MIYFVIGLIVAFLYLLWLGLFRSIAMQDPEVQAKPRAEAEGWRGAKEYTRERLESEDRHA